MIRKRGKVMGGSTKKLVDATYFKGYILDLKKRMNIRSKIYTDNVKEVFEEKALKLLNLILKVENKMVYISVHSIIEISSVFADFGMDPLFKIPKITKKFFKHSGGTSDMHERHEMGGGGLGSTRQPLIDQVLASFQRIVGAVVKCDRETKSVLGKLFDGLIIRLLSGEIYSYQCEMSRADYSSQQNDAEYENQNDGVSHNAYNGQTQNQNQSQNSYGRHYQQSRRDNEDQDMYYRRQFY
jgi:hypothetical protein